jgi:hypothetical protein
MDTITSIQYFYDFTSSDPILKSEGDFDYNPVTVYFSDNLFNGKKVSLSLQLNQLGFGFLDDSCNCIFAELRSVSYSYFQYLKKWTIHLYNQGVHLDVRDSEELREFLFTGEPVNMYTNVQNGYGIFAGYSKSTYNMRKVN